MVSNEAVGRTGRRGLLDGLFHRGTVESVQDVARHMRRIRVAGEFTALAWIPGQHLRVFVHPSLTPRTLLTVRRDALRSYTVLDGDPSAGWLDLCVFDHPGNGPGAQWARAVLPGDPVRFMGPEGDLVARDGACHVFVGDESAAVAFSAILSRLPATATVLGVIEIGDPGSELTMARGAELTWLTRSGVPAPATEQLLDAVRALDLPAEQGVAYVAGEARSCQAVRAFLTRERGWSRRAVHTKPFWAPGKRGLE